MENNRGDNEKVIFRASSGDLEPAKKAPPQSAGPSPERPPRQQQQPQRKKQRKRRRRWPLVFIPIAILLVLAGGAGYVFTTYVNNTYAYYTGPDEALSSAEPHSYTVSSEEEAITYLSHPSLHEGDTVVVNGDLFLDINESFGGLLSIGLVNFDCSNCSITFSEGTAILASGREESVNMSGISFSDTNVFIEAAGVDLTWLEAGAEAKINTKTLNGLPSLNEFVINAPGGKMTIPVTIHNISGVDQNDIEIQFISPSFLFENDGKMTTSIPAGGSETVNVDVVVTEGGRAQIFAVGKDASGAKAVEGYSDYIELLGGGYYSGDPHTHTNESYTERYDSNLEDNVKYAAEKGHSFIISVENDEFAEKLPQSAIDSIVGEEGTFLQLTALETGEKNQLRHLMLYNYDSEEIIDSDYEVTPYRNYTIQDAIWAALEESPDAIIYIPHPFGYDTDLLESLYSLQSLMGIRGIEILDQTAFSNETEFVLTLQTWDNINVYDRQRLFAIGASNNLHSEYVGSRYTKGYMPELSEENIYNMLNTGNMFASNGPELRFSLGGVDMGQELEVNLGETFTAKIYASSTTPLTSVKIVRHDVDGVWEDLEPDYVLNEELSGQGLYVYEAEVTLTPPTNIDERTGEEVVQKSIYRLEVYAEATPYYDNVDQPEVGMAFGNPIWVSAATAGSSDTSLGEVGYDENPPATLFGLDINLGFLNGLVENTIENRYGMKLYGIELKTNVDGTRYFGGEGTFTINALSTKVRENQIKQIDYHRYHSSALADKVTVMVMAENRVTKGVETMYILD